MHSQLQTDRNRFYKSLSDTVSSFGFNQLEKLYFGIDSIQMLPEQSEVIGRLLFVQMRW